MFPQKMYFHVWVFIALASFACTTTADKEAVPVVSETESKTLETANALAKDGLLKEAIEKYRKVLAINAQNKLARRNLAVVYLRGGQFKTAVKHFAQVMGFFENDFETNFYYGEALRGLDKYAEAIFRYQNALKINADEPRAMKSLAWSYFKIRYYSESFAIARKLIKISPNDGQVAIILARTLVKLNRTKQALTIIRHAKRSAQVSSSLPYFYSVEGDIYLAMDDCIKASEAYKLALKDQPLLAGALLGLGRCELNNGNVAKGISFMERAIRIRPTLTEGFYYLGKAYENKDRKKSLNFYKTFEKSAAKDPEFLAQLPEIKERIAGLKIGK